MSNVLDKFGVNKEKLADQTEDGGGFDFEPPAKGPCVARLVGYIECGMQPQRPKDGKDQPDIALAYLEFQLLGKKHAKVIKVKDENGKEVEKTIYPIHRERVAVKLSHRSNSYSLLQAMDYGRGNTHFAYMLGEGFKINLIHNEVEGADKKKRVYVNIRNDNGWTIGAPVIEKADEDGELIQQAIAVPEPQGVELRMLLQDDPTKAQWDSIYIDGSYTKKDKDGNEEEVSKNWLQEMCMKATDFEGSALQAMLLESGGDLPELSQEDLEGSTKQGDPGEEASEEQAPEDLPDEGTPEETAPADDADDPLADLGL